MTLAPLRRGFLLLRLLLRPVRSAIPRDSNFLDDLGKDQQAEQHQQQFPVRDDRIRPGDDKPYGQQFAGDRKAALGSEVIIDLSAQQLMALFDWR